MNLSWLLLALPLLSAEPRAVRGVVLTNNGTPLEGVCVERDVGAAYVVPAESLPGRAEAPSRTRAALVGHAAR